VPVTVFGNHKGGVGKTTAVACIAGQLAQQGRRVLAVDLDPQGNLTRRVGGYSEAEIAERPSIAEAVRDATPATLRSAIVPCQWDIEWAARIDIVPSRIELEERVPEAGVPGSWLRLKRALDGVAAEYDDVLIDTPPTIGHLLHLALVAADHVVACTTLTYDAIRGVLRLRDFVQAEGNRSALGLTCRMIGVIPSQKRSGLVIHQSRSVELNELFGDLVWEPAVPLRAAVEQLGELAEPPHLASDEVRWITEQHVQRYLRAVGAREVAA